MPQFVLKITLGNDAMQSTADIGEKLRDTADEIEQYGESNCPRISGKIMDLNGNTVGSWMVK